MQTQMLTVQDVATMFGVSINTIYRLANKPDGIRTYKIGRILRFKPEEVEEYLSNHVIEPVYDKNGFHGVHFKYVPGMKVV